MALVIPSGIYQLYNAGMDATITANSIPMLLIFPSKQIGCINCRYNTLTKTSSNIYNGTGPIPFQQGVCPYCAGKGFTTIEQSASFSAVAYYDLRPGGFLRNIIETNIQLNIPGDYIQTKSFFTDYANVKRAEKLRLSQLTANNVSLEYKIFGEPLPVGFNNRYLLCNWKRI